MVQNAYTFDNAGQRLTNQITSNGSSRTEQYSYDEMNRLKTVDYGDGQTQSYSFDAMCNRTSKQDSFTGSENYSYDATNMLVGLGGNSYSNDANGNRVVGGGCSNIWDSQNRLVQCVSGANTSSFVYGADGLRRQSTINGVTTDFVLENSMFVRERNHANGTNIATYLVGMRGPEYRRDDITGQIRWYLYDGLGSVLGEVDPNGNITSSRKYDVYGLVRGGTNPVGTSSHKFAGRLGHSSEGNTNLIYMQARYYDPIVGRFISRDTVPTFNRYIYCQDDPVNRTDPSGHFSLTEEGGAIAEGLGLDAGSGGAVEAFGSWFQQRLATAIGRETIKLTVEFIEEDAVEGGSQMGMGYFQASLNYVKVFLVAGAANPQLLCHELAEAEQWLTSANGFVSDAEAALFRAFQTFM